MNYLLQQIINALGYGGVIALLAAGYTMTFGIINLVNFAYGEVFMLGAFAAYFCINIWNLPFWLVFLIGIAASIVVGFVIERTTFKPVRGADMVTLFITGLGASIVVRNLAVMIFDDRLKSFSLPDFLKGLHSLGDILLFNKTIAIVLVTLVIGLVLIYLVKKTKIGIAMRSISYNAQMSKCLGMNSEKVIIITFIISSSLAGIAAYLQGILFGSIQASMGFTAVVYAFIASVMGGVGNIVGAMVMGYFLAIGGNLFIAFLPPDLVGLKSLFVWGVFFLILIFRPSGLFRANIK